MFIDARGLEREWPELARTICRRRFGVGADGLILLLDSDRADFGMRFFNPDGSEAEACGNGLRCFAEYVREKGFFPKSSRLKIETWKGIKVAEIKGEAVKVGMGWPELEPAPIPVSVEASGPILDYPLEVKGRKLRLSFVSMGNPHAICFLEEPLSDFPLTEIGPALESHSLFPQKTNFEVVRELAPGQMEVRVWERGVGETFSCGTGACAVAVVAYLKNLAGREVEIKLPGGNLKVEWDELGEVWLSGLAELVFEGEWPD